MGVAIIWAFGLPDAKGFQEPKLARIVFFHLPAAFIASGFFFAGAWYSWRYLRSRRWSDDLRALAGIEIATLMAVQTMLSGIIFSKVQWGAYWNWDPRQTSFLMVLLMFGSYFAIRAAFPDPEKRAANGAGYALASVLPALFLIFIFPRLPMNQQLSLHPDVIGEQFSGGQASSAVEIRQGDSGKASAAPATSSVPAGFDRAHTAGLFGIGILWLVTCIWAFRMRVRAGVMEHRAESAYETMDDRGGSAALGVVRPVPLHAESGGESEEG